MEQRFRVHFKCPKCGSNRIFKVNFIDENVEVVFGIYRSLHSPLHFYVDTLPIIPKNKIAFERFVCGDCEYIIPGIYSASKLYEWLNNHKMIEEVLS